MALANIKGLVRIALVRARAIGDEPVEVPGFFECFAIAGELSRYWSAVSKGALELVSQVHPRVVQLPFDAEELSSLPRGTIANAIAKAASEDLDLGQFDIWVGFVNTPCEIGQTGNRVIAGSYQQLGQRAWARCAKCQSLAHWDQTIPPGKCAVGGLHDHSGSSWYVARFEGQGAGDTGWRWCRNCACLARPDRQPGACPAGGNHEHSASGAYLVSVAATPASQSQWRRCSRCTVLVFGGSPSAPCPAGGVHQLPEGEFFVGIDQFPPLGFLCHETGHALGLKHSFNDSPEPLDKKDDSHPGAYGDPWDIMSYIRTSSFRSAQFINTGPGLAAPTLFKNGWIGPDRVFFLRHPGDVELVSTSEPIADGFLTAVVGVSGSATVYSIEYRTAQNYDQAVVVGVLIREHTAVADTPSLGLLAQNGWRWCSRCGSLVYRGHRACAGGSEHVSDGTTVAAHLGAPVPPGSQGGWLWCSRCQSLVNEQSGVGVCASGGRHDTSRSGHYAVIIKSPADPEVPLWLWCRNCKSLYLPNPDSGRCPTGGGHDGSASAHYRIAPAGADTQEHWTSCLRCRCVFYNGLGACPAGDIHETSQSVDYFIVHDIDWAPGQAGWRWCSKCYGLAFLDSSRGPGKCAAGGVHQHGISGTYSVEFVQPHLASIPQVFIDDVEQVGWAWCHRCEMLGFSKLLSRCPAGGQHDFSRSAAYRLRFAVNGKGDEGHLQQSRSWQPGETFTSRDGLFTAEVLAFHTQPSRVSLRINVTALYGSKNLVQSNWGRKGNFELLVPQGDVVTHYFRENDDPNLAWHRNLVLSYKRPPNQLGSHPTAVTFIQSNFRGDSVHGNFEAVVRVRAPIASEPDTLDFWFLDSQVGKWSGPFPFVADGQPITGVTGNPILIQSTWGSKGNFELLVPQGDVVTHYFRDNDDPNLAWHRNLALSYKRPPNQLGPHPTAVTFIQSNFRGDGVHGNLQAVVRVRAPIASEPDTLDFWFLDSRFGKWSGPFPLIADGNPITGVTGDPILIQSNKGRHGNFELLVPQGDVVTHYFRENDDPNLAWHRNLVLSYKRPPNQLGSHPTAVTFIQSNFRGDSVHGNFEAVVRVPAPITNEPDTLNFWFLDSQVGKWSGPFPFIADGQPISDVTGF